MDGRPCGEQLTVRNGPLVHRRAPIEDAIELLLPLSMGGGSHPHELPRLDVSHLVENLDVQARVLRGVEALRKRSGGARPDERDELPEFFVRDRQLALDGG